MKTKFLIKPLRHRYFSLFKVNNRNTRTGCQICPKLTVNEPERHQSREDGTQSMTSFGVFIVNFEHISHLVLVFL